MLLLLCRWRQPNDFRMFPKRTCGCSCDSKATKFTKSKGAKESSSNALVRLRLCWIRVAKKLHQGVGKVHNHGWLKTQNCRTDQTSSQPVLFLRLHLCQRHQIHLHPLSFIGTRLLKNQCGECDQVLDSKAALESHISLYTCERPFFVLILWKEFTNSASLKGTAGCIAMEGSMSVNSAGRASFNNHIRPFVCHICNKGCLTKLDLLAHRHVHTGEKPFHWYMCDKKFNRRVNWNVHLHWHSGEKAPAFFLWVGVFRL